MNNYFVMLNHPNGRILPMIDEDENLAMYGSVREAVLVAKENPLGEAYGFEVFCRGCGEL